MTTLKHDEAKKPEENGTPTSNPSVIPTDIMDYLLKAFVLIGVGASRRWRRRSSSTRTSTVRW
jgi:hypothetical protein